MTLKYALIFAMMTGPALAEETRTWTLFTQSVGGTVSMSHGLTKRECDFALARATGQPTTQEGREQKRAAIEGIVERGKNWCRKHPDGAISEGSESYNCNKDGTLNNVGWPGPPVMSGDMKHAECFQ